LTLVPNEETGGAGGSHGWRAKVSSPERRGHAPGGADERVIWNANAERFAARAGVREVAHVGLQHQGENAFERMHRVVARLQTLKHEVERRTTRSRIGAEQARNSILMLATERRRLQFQRGAGELLVHIDRRINPKKTRH